MRIQTASTVKASAVHLPDLKHNPNKCVLPYVQRPQQSTIKSAAVRLYNCSLTDNLKWSGSLSVICSPVHCADARYWISRNQQKMFDKYRKLPVPRGVAYQSGVISKWSATELVDKYSLITFVLGRVHIGTKYIFFNPSYFHLKVPQSMQWVPTEVWNSNVLLAFNNQILQALNMGMLGSLSFFPSWFGGRGLAYNGDRSQDQILRERPNSLLRDAGLTTCA